MSTIVVGYVPKPEGEAAVRRAVEEAKLRNSRVIVVNSHRGGREFDDDDSGRTEEELGKVEQLLRDAGVEFDVRQLVRGQDPADDLISIAWENSADLIVIGLRRRTPVGKLILGSNAQQILLQAPCAVLAVKATTT